MGPGPVRGVPSVGGFLKYPNDIYASFGENHGKLRKLGRQVRPGIEPGTSRLPVLRAEQLGHWLGVLFKH